MNILIITHEYPPVGGGGATACRFLCENLTKRGHRGTVLTCAYSNQPKKSKEGNFTIIRIAAVRKRTDKSTFFEMLTFLCSVWISAQRRVRREKYDVCQVFFGIPSGPAALMLKRKYGLPYIIRFGGGDIPGAQKRFSLVYKVLAPYIRLIWKNAAFLVANSKGLKTRAEKFENRYPIEVICNGVDTDFFRPDKTRKSGQEEMKILFVSRLIEGKGLQFVIPYLADIEKMTRRIIKLTIVGDGPYRKELEKISVQSGADGRVIFAGKKSRDELLAYYQGADLFILPSESEGMPNVVLEAMAAGLSIVMTPCEGSEELVTDNGFIASREMFIKKIVQLGKDSQLCEKMGSIGRKRAIREFSWENTAALYEDLYRRSC